MARKLEKRAVVIVGGGLTAALIARQLTAKNIDVLVLEHGTDHRSMRSTIRAHSRPLSNGSLR
jgi:gluconate 2-dehydrogenase alpha chain